METDMSFTILRPPLHENFQLPTREELLQLKEGGLVKLIFQADGGTPERMWVLVNEKHNDEKWIGALDNDPVGEELQKVIKSGDSVSFHPHDVIQIYE
jgi:hypothetical protein